MPKTFILHFLCLFFVYTTHAEIKNSASDSGNQKIVQKNGTFFCRTFGKGSPLIVIHGGPGLSQDYLLPQMQELAKNHLVIFYDQRGCGLSEAPITSETITMTGYLDDLEAIRQAFGFQKVSILGHSWGGFLAMEYAITHPEHVEKLILSNSMPATSEDYALFIQEYMRRTAPLEEELTKIHASRGFQEGDPVTLERLHHLIFQTYCYLPENANLLHTRLSSQAAKNGQKIYEYFREALFAKNFNLLPQLEKLNIPTLVIHGNADVIPLVTAEHIAQTIPHAQFIVIKDCGHFPYVEQPAFYFSSIDNFLARKTIENNRSKLKTP
jgi:proline iminopeptidase